MLFLLNKRNQIILRPEALKLVPAFKNLTKEESLFMILFMDYNSPYHQLPDRERLEKSLRHVYSTRNRKVTKVVTKACEKYAELQYDERRTTMDSYQQKIQVLRKAFDETNNTTEIINLSDTIEKLQRKMEKLQHDINYDEQTDAVLYGREEKSLIETLQQNKRLSEMRDESVFPRLKILYQPNDLGTTDGSNDNS